MNVFNSLLFNIINNDIDGKKCIVQLVQHILIEFCFEIFKVLVEVSLLNTTSRKEKNNSTTKFNSHDSKEVSEWVSESVYE
jgi:hypothetical protein